MKPEISVSIYNLKGGSYQLSYVDPVKNKRIRKKFGSLKEAKTFEKIVLNRHASPDFNKESSTPLMKFIPRYLEQYPQAKMVTRSPFLYKSFLETFGEMPVADVNKGNLGEWLQKLRDEKQYSSRTMVLNKYCFTPFFTYLVDLGVIGDNPLIHVRLNRNGPRKLERIVLAELELKEILEKFKTISPTEVFPIIYFQAHTGARIGETLQLKWSDVDLEAGRVELVSPMKKDRRVLNVSENLLTVLRSLAKTGDFVFVDEDSKPWTVDRFYKVFRRAYAKGDFKRDFNNQAFRHTFAYHFLRKGGRLHQLQVILGHRNIDMTLYMYGNVLAKYGEATTPYSF